MNNDGEKMQHSLERYMVIDACIEALRSGAAHKECAMKPQSGFGIGEIFLSRFQWADWLKENRESILKSIDSGKL